MQEKILAENVIRYNNLKDRMDLQLFLFYVCEEIFYMMIKKF